MLEATRQKFMGLCFVNLVDFDMKYGHRRDIAGYAKAVMEMDCFLQQLYERLGEDDCMIVTADHGCDPSHMGTDHTREYVPILIAGKKIRSVSLGTRSSFADLGKTCTELLGADASALAGTSFRDTIVF